MTDNEPSSDGLRSEPIARRGRSRLGAQLSLPLFRNAYFLILSSGLASAIGLPFWALAARLYSPRTVGLASTSLSAMMLVSGIGQLGMSSILVRHLPVAGSATRHFVVRSYLSTASLTLVLAVVAASTSHIWSPPLSFLGYDAGWFVLFCGAAMTWTVFTLEDSVLTGLRETRWVAVENAAFSVAKLALVIALAHVERRAGIFLAWIVPGMILIFPVNLAIFGRFLPRRALASASAKSQWNSASLRRLIVGNYAGSLSTLAAGLLLPVLVANEAGATAAAYFYVGLTIETGVVLVAANISTSLLVESALAESEARDHTRRAIVASVGIVGALALVAIVFAPQVLSIFGPRYEAHGTVALRILMLGTVPAAIALVALTGARLRHDGRLVAFATATMAVCTLGLSALLLPDMGITGAALGGTIAQVLFALTLAPALRRELKRPV